ncbi:hypothetical protein N802_11105 [Knoellia sinensis KCTC 19936]|uniref:DUF732 domain-containing protein n=1 Tax=Knoellia sinensis KCTC 19936 TaxID=1385520 RepID=A0A0A0J490_9MICO|nr:DUF732 domain-containing protein [Knoellia sinensis]KGN32190.1 hypothetical protein N802_11105 [Knoellia sinensis KCTC 19936]
MPRLRTPATLLISGAVALGLSACSSDDPPEATPTPTASASAPSPAATNSGIVPDNVWAGVIKRAVPVLAETPDAEIVTAAKKVCTTFEAEPNKASATAILKDTETTLELDTVQARVFASAAITHFCTDRSDEWTEASIG